MSPQHNTYRGITTPRAREILVQVASKRCWTFTLEREKTVPLGWMVKQELLRNVSSACAVVVLFLGYIFSEDHQVTVFALDVAVLWTFLAGALVKVVRRRCEAFELQDRVLAACDEYAASMGRADTPGSGSTDTPFRSAGGPSVGLRQGGAFASIVSVYRDDVWQRIPKLLLVEGDVVAFMAGDIAPCRVELLQVTEDTRRAHVASAGGDKDGEPLGTPDLCQPCGGDAGMPGSRRQESQGLASRENACPVDDSSGPRETQLSEGTASSMASTKPSVQTRQQFSMTFHGTGTQVPAGGYIELRPMTGDHFSRRMLVPSTSPALLLLCGDMRCYRLLETPLEFHLEVRSKESRMHLEKTTWVLSLLRERIGAATLRCYRVAIICIALAAAVGGLRLALANESRGSWPLYLLIVPGQVAVCLLPMSLPMYLAVGDLIVTARLLAFLELMLARKRETESVRISPAVPENDEFDQMDAEEREEMTSGTSHTVSWAKARAYFTAVAAARWTCAVRSRSPSQHPKARKSSICGSLRQCCHPVRKGTGTRRVARECRTGLERSAMGGVNSGIDTAEGRSMSPKLSPSSDGERDTSKRVMGGHGSLRWRRIVPWERRIQGWTHRRREQKHGGAASPPYGDAWDEGRIEFMSKRTTQRRTLLPVPLLECGLVERLGAVTTLCMLDEDAVCNPCAAIKEVFLLDAKDETGRGSGTVLDMHAQQGKKGVYFEDPQWWTHFAALKPIGLTCLLADYKQSEKQAARSKWGPSPSPPDDHAPSTQRRLRRNEPGRALLEHVRDDQPMEHLTQLWKAIGFSAGDR